MIEQIKHEIEMLRQLSEIERKAGHTQSTWQIIRDVAARLDALTVAATPVSVAVRAALEPFANLANGYDDAIDSDDRPVGPVALKFCRAARSALAAPQVQEGCTWPNCKCTEWRGHKCPVSRPVRGAE